MLTWLSDNAATLIISAALLAAVILILRSLVRKKGHACSCGDCGACPACGQCHKAK